MKKIILVILLFAFTFGQVALAVPRDAEGYYIWQAPGGNPRNPDGVRSREQYRSWMLGNGGQNDLIRCGMPENIRYMAQEILRRQAYGQNNKITFSTGEWGFIEEMTVISGSKYRQITYANGQVIDRVKMMFNGDVFRMIIVDKFDVVWHIDTFMVCANSGRNVISLYFPKPRPEKPKPQPEVIIKYYYPEQVYIPTYNRAEELSVRFSGVLNGGVGEILGRWLGRSKTNIVFSGGNANAYGGSATASSWQEQQQQQQQQQRQQGGTTYNNNTNNNFQQTEVIDADATTIGN